MTRSKCLLLSVTFGLLIGLAYVAPAAAETSDSPQRVERNRAELSGAPGFEVISSVSEYKPGETLPRHLHHGLEAAYVIQGATLQAPGKEPTSLPTGASVLNLRDVPHGGFVIVGDTPLKLFTVHVVEKGKPLYDFVK